MPRLVKVDPASEEGWGKLVKSWATGKSYFPGVPASDLPIPRTVDEVKAQCAAVGVSIAVDPMIKAISFIQHSPEVWTVRLPPKSMIEASEAELTATNAALYDLPKFYKTYCGPTNVPAGQELTLHACRIGDYTLSVCL